MDITKIPTHEDLQPWQQRVIDERAELLARLSKLRMFFESAQFASLSLIDQTLLRMQHTAMGWYESILSFRVLRFSQPIE